MKPRLALARWIDAVNERVGRAVTWLVLAATLISAANALARYGLNLSSNAWLEIQWYLFGAIILLTAGYTLKHNGHVRIDVIYGLFSVRTQAWIDLLGTLLFLLPLCGLMTWLAFPGFVESLQSGETSPDAGGLPLAGAAVDPARLCAARLQGVSEAIKRIAFLGGKGKLTREQPQEEV